MEIATPASASAPVNAAEVNCEPWSVLKISGLPNLASASTSAERQNETSIVFDKLRSRFKRSRCAGPFQRNWSPSLLVRSRCALNLYNGIALEYPDHRPACRRIRCRQSQERIVYRKGLMSGLVVLHGKSLIFEWCDDLRRIFAPSRRWTTSGPPVPRESAFQRSLTRALMSHAIHRVTGSLLAGRTRSAPGRALSNRFPIRGFDAAFAGFDTVFLQPEPQSVRGCGLDGSGIAPSNGYN